ncbi:hypothetical protein MMC17_009963 [Xylographa soralifera]|nr:hypothetical protein [Xylographa soralifera]
MLTYSRLKFFRSLHVSASYRLLSTITPNGFARSKSSPEVVELSHFSPTICKIITQQDYEIPASDINSIAAGDLATVLDLSKVQKQAGQELPIQEMLVTAIFRRHANVAEYCLQQGATIDDDVTFAAYTHPTAALFEVLFPRNIFNLSKHPEFLSNLLDEAVQVGWNPRLYDAPLDPEGVRVAAFLLARGAEISEDTVLGAARYQSVDFMECLLAHGAVLAGSGALHTAASHGRIEMATYLLDHGADVNELLSRNISGDIREPWPQMGFPLHYAVSFGKFDAVMLLLGRGGDITLRNEYDQCAFEVEKLGGDEESHQEIAQLLQYVQEHTLKRSSESKKEQEPKGRI